MSHPFMLLILAGLALVGVVIIAWRSRARAVTRWFRVLNAYAEREIAQGQHGKARTRTFATVLSVRGKARARGTEASHSRRDGQMRGRVRGRSPAGFRPLPGSASLRMTE